MIHLPYFQTLTKFLYPAFSSLNFTQHISYNILRISNFPNSVICKNTEYKYMRFSPRKNHMLPSFTTNQSWIFKLHCTVNLQLIKYIRRAQNHINIYANSFTDLL